jgi:outer membrane protein assembly factor BamB
MRWNMMILVVWLLINSVFPGGEDWPMYQHDPQHTGYSPSGMPESLKKAWVSESVGEPFISNLVVSEEIIFASGYISISTFDINTGAKIREYGNPKGGIMCPAVEDNRIYLNANEGIYCLDINTKEKVWDHHVRYLNFLSYPIFIDGKVFVGGGSPIEFFPGDPQAKKLLEKAQKRAQRVMCLDAATGDIVWEFYAKDRAIYSPAYFNGKIYVNTESGYVHCLDAKTGELIWEKIIEGRSRASLSLDGKRIFIRTYEGLICLDIETGETLWKFKAKSKLYRTPSVAYDTVFLPAGEILYCLDAETGDTIWELKAESHISTHIVVADKKAAFGTIHGVLYLVSATSGRIYDFVDLQYGTLEYESEITALTLSDGKLIAGQGEGITCFEGSDCNLSFIPIFVISVLFVVILVLYRKISIKN